MMGRKVRAFSALVNVSLQNLVPKDHFYRHVERTLDLAFVRDLVRPCYTAGGRSSIRWSCSSFRPTPGWV